MPRILYYLVCSILTILFLFPLAWTLLMTFKTPTEASASPPTFFPRQFTLQSYVRIFSAGIASYLGNSTLVVLITVVVAVVLSMLAGYGFSRFSFPGKNVIFVLILTTLMIPFQSILTPLFLLLHFIGLNNSLVGLALVYITFQLPFSIFMMRNSFESVPRELEEAGLIDGCSTWSLLTRVMMPVVFPGIITVALFAFFATWNEFLAALIFINDTDKYTLPIYLLNLQSGLYGTIDFGALNAGLIITILPSVIIFLLLQRYYINGLVAGAVK
ncbi:ABC transporter permease [Dictyobacter aurantiacus]|uniref:ABC transporter permease n=1 Tax=Dictyobacter aurantiacus TaxID=1936993 RepID=A0A401ZLY4_9CHLR|nr:ABC transporter permease [Dictyobacter aurantiacus]